ncbi:MAG TPA: 50S ribosomal protein L6 [Candidatus Binatia bacterium]|nr:50S ribosomal protein L6 [Candidatus Binatia bacterium]
MSRIGKLPLVLPQGVTVKVADGHVRVEGPKGKLTRPLEPEVAIEVAGNTVHVKRRGDSRRARSVHGLVRKLVGNMVEGAGRGFTRVLEINGVGYRAEVRGKILFLTLGYSHPIAFQLPEGVTAKVERQVIVTLEGADRELLGQTAAAIRGLRAPEPYKGKGVKYAEETIRRKAGKSAAGATR